MASTTILHDTALAAWADGDVIFLYFQASSGFLCEATLTPGQPQVAYTITNLRAADIKLYTPLAATFGKNTEERYIFYIDTDGILNNAVYKNDTWCRGFLRGQSIIPAHYSKIAAVKSCVWDDDIHVFYQTTNRNGAIRQVTGYENRWVQDRRDLGSKVLTGTGLAAVHAGLGIDITTGTSASNKPPVVFFQQTNLGLAWLQDTATRKVGGVVTKASPHTPLAATDAVSTNLKDVFLFFTSSANEIKRLAIGSDGQEIVSTELLTTTPKGNLAAVVRKSSTNSTDAEIILFYQSTNPPTIHQSTMSDDDGGNCVCKTGYTVTEYSGVAIFSDPEVDHIAMRFE
ncbi:Fungal fucose-specific lectin [Metarhizium brunneum]